MTYIKPLGVQSIEQGATGQRHDRAATALVSASDRRTSFRRGATLVLSAVRRFFLGQSIEDARAEYERTHPKPLHLLARAEARRSREARKARSHAHQALRKRGGDAA